MAEPSIPPGFDFTDPELYVQRIPAEEFAELRRIAPVWWNQQPRGASGFDDEGYWVVTRHADVLEVSRHSEIFSSEEKSALIRHGQPVTDEAIEMQRLILLNLDPPRAHQAARHRLPRASPPGRSGTCARRWPSALSGSSQAALAEGTGDFVTDVACELPLQAIAELLGHPAGGPAQDLRLVEPDDRLRRSRVRGRPPRPPRPSSSATHDDGRGPQAVPARRHRHQAGQRAGGRRAACPRTSSGSS